MPEISFVPCKSGAVDWEVSDGIIAPDYTDEALEILKGKKKGAYNIIKIDPDYMPFKQEIKQVYGKNASLPRATPVTVSR